MATSLADARSTTAAANGAARPHRPLVEALVVLTVAAGAAIACTWPLATELGRVAHDAYDPLVQAWTLDWVQHAIRSPSHLFDANMFAPQPDTLAYSDSLIGIAIPFLPLRWLGVSPIAQLNVAVLVGTTFTAASAYLFGRVATGSRAVAAVTGAGFAFGPIATVHLGHVQTIWRAGMPLSAAAVWVLADRAERGASTWPPALALFAALSWQASVSFGTTAYAAVTVVVVLLVRARSLGRRGGIAAALALVGAAGVTLLLAIPYLENSARFHDFNFPLKTVSGYYVDFTKTDPRIWLWGSALGRGTGWPALGGMSFPGVVLLVLTPFGAVSAWRDRRMRRVAVAGLALVVTGLALGIGASNKGWRQFTPYRVLYDFVPGWHALRAADRTWLVGLLGMSLLAGVGARAIGRWLAARGFRAGVAVVTALAAVAILVEGYAPWTGLPTARVHAVDTYLASLHTPGGVVYLPGNATGTDVLDLSFFDQPADMYESTAHHRPMPNGFSSYVPKSYARTFAKLRSLPDERALGTLRALGIRYVVVHPKVAGGPWDRLLRPDLARPLRFVGRFGTDLLYEVPGARSGRRS
ncbi:MAG TPA: hypothetical protein VEP49_14880 [Acidimicrobiia bacterium]|nr:hypothetical protein [Acidimicrobiia bacterium]